MSEIKAFDLLANLELANNMKYLEKLFAKPPVLFSNYEHVIDISIPNKLYNSLENHLAWLDANSLESWEYNFNGFYSNTTLISFYFENEMASIHFKMAFG